MFVGEHRAKLAPEARFVIEVTFCIKTNLSESAHQMKFAAVVKERVAPLVGSLRQTFFVRYVNFVKPAFVHNFLGHKVLIAIGIVHNNT